MSKIIDEIQQTKHSMYDQYMRSTTVIKLKQGDSLEVKVNGIVMKTYTALYSNAHFNIEIQDKGIQNPENLTPAHTNK